MKSVQLPLPLLATVAATRGMLGFGAGLLLGERLTDDTRHTLGWALVAVGVLSTIPLGINVFSRRSAH
jgi:hypothetical protein